MTNKEIHPSRGQQQGQTGYITLNITQNNNYYLGLINPSDSEHGLNPFFGYQQTLRKQRKSPYSRLGWF